MGRIKVHRAKTPVEHSPLEMLAHGRQMLAHGRQKPAYPHFAARIFRKTLAEQLTHFIRKLLWQTRTNSFRNALRFEEFIGPEKARLGESTHVTACYTFVQKF